MKKTLAKIYLATLAALLLGLLNVNAYAHSFGHAASALSQDPSLDKDSKKKLKALKNAPLAERRISDWFAATDNLYLPADDHRTGEGRPGTQYWQNQADYVIRVTLDEQRDFMEGKVAITYHNKSPNSLHRIWLQLEQEAISHKATFANGLIMRNLEPQRINDPKGKKAILSIDSSARLRDADKWGFNITSVTLASGNKVPLIKQGSVGYFDLPQALTSGSSISFSIDYSFFVPSTKTATLSRMGFQQFDDGKKAYYLTHFYPRVAVYDRAEGWDIRPYLGTGEFNLEFGNFDLYVSTPANHVLLATGELQNPQEVLSAVQQERLAKVMQSKEPIDIISETEAKSNIAAGSTSQMKTWHFSAKNVRDVGMASSQRFAWQSMKVSSGPRENRPVIAHNIFSPSSDPFSPKIILPAIQHTLDVFTKRTFDYPYPMLALVQSDRLGMEYPMLGFYPAAKKGADGNYSSESKSPTFITAIHEAAHNFTPMIVSPNERKWSWLDEGLTTFLHQKVMETWSPAVRENHLQSMKGIISMLPLINAKLNAPIMTLSDNLSVQDMSMGVLAYTKPALALDVLREAVIGPEMFDKAFESFFQTWRFKHPEPYDFFRHIEQVSGRELGWFWRSWFYTSKEYVDIAITGATVFTLDQNAQILPPSTTPGISPFFSSANTLGASNKEASSNVKIEFLVDKVPSAKDKFDEISKAKPTPTSNANNANNNAALTPTVTGAEKFLQVKFQDRGGIISPVIFDIIYADGTSKRESFSENVWRFEKNRSIDIVVPIENKPLKKIVFDHSNILADSVEDNNVWDAKKIRSETVYLQKPQNLLDK